MRLTIPLLILLTATPSFADEFASVRVKGISTYEVPVQSIEIKDGNESRPGKLICIEKTYSYVIDGDQAIALNGLARRPGSTIKYNGVNYDVYTASVWPLFMQNFELNTRCVG